MKEHSSSL